MKANYNKQYPKKLNSIDEIKHVLSKDEIAPTTSIRTNADIYKYKSNEYYPSQTSDIYHAMTIIGYDKDDENEDVLILQNQIGGNGRIHQANVVKISVKDHPESIKYAYSPFIDTSQGISNPMTMRLSDDCGDNTKEQLGYFYKPAIGGDCIAGDGVINAIVCGGDAYAQMKANRYAR